MYEKGINRNDPRGILRMALPAVALFAFTACESTTLPPPPDVWAGPLAGEEGHETLAGIAEVVSSGTLFVAGLEIEGAPAEATLTWTVAAGTCGAPGEAYGDPSDYPLLEVDEEGRAEAVTTIARSLSVGEDLHLAIRHHDEEADEEAVLVACGDLEPIS